MQQTQALGCLLCHLLSCKRQRMLELYAPLLICMLACMMICMMLKIPIFSCCNALAEAPMHNTAIWLQTTNIKHILASCARITAE